MQITLALLGLGSLASACTTVLVNTTSGVGVIGRTMELGSMDLPTDVRPQGRAVVRSTAQYCGFYFN